MVKCKQVTKWFWYALVDVKRVLQKQMKPRADFEGGSQRAAVVQECQMPEPCHKLIRYVQTQVHSQPGFNPYFTSMVPPSFPAYSQVDLLHIVPLLLLIKSYLSSHLIFLLHLDEKVDLSFIKRAGRLFIPSGPGRLPGRPAVLLGASAAAGNAAPGTAHAATLALGHGRPLARGAPSAAERR